jgi:hypothetical protein
MNTCLSSHVTVAVVAVAATGAALYVRREAKPR